MKRQTGFTLMELMVTLVVIGVLAGVAIPAFTTWLPNYHLKNAALDLFSTYQQAKLMAVRANATHRVVFDPANDRYTLQDGGGNTLRTVDLDQYGRPGEVTFGGGDATKDAGDGLDPVPGDGVSFSGDQVTFNARGMSMSGFAYLQNTRGTGYAIGAQSTGLIVMEKWRGGDWE